MKFSILSMILLLFLFININADDKMENTIYKFSAKTIDGTETSLSQYKGKVVLIVNTASKCGFTKQYEGLEKLYEEYKDNDFVILGFPCNQFGAQEPGSNSDIKSFCTLNYGVSFPMFEKVDVNGDNAHALYKFLVKEKSGMLGDSIKWNFTKFLINKQGEVVERFAPQTTPESLNKEIEKLISK